MSNQVATDYRRVARAIAFLSARHDQQPALEEAARAAGLSPFHFQRLFTRYAGVSPKSFVGHLTLERAKRELSQGASVLDASFASGLSGPSRLHDLCLKIEAMTPGEYARGGAGLEIAYGFHPSPFGTALVMATAKGICGLAFADEGKERPLLDEMRARWPKAAYRNDEAATAKIATRIFDGEKDFPGLGLHLIGTKWQIKVWQALLAIPEGRVASYRAIAEAIGRPTASRAVGAAVGRNPVALLIPCHRVLKSGGELHHYHWGTDRKRALLALEAARTERNPEKCEAVFR